MATNQAIAPSTMMEVETFCTHYGRKTYVHPYRAR